MTADRLATPIQHWFVLGTTPLGVEVYVFRARDTGKLLMTSMLPDRGYPEAKAKAILKQAEQIAPSARYTLVSAGFEVPRAA